jgi:hypothetical protein
MSEKRSASTVAAPEEADSGSMDNFATGASWAIFGIFGVAAGFTLDSFKAMWLVRPSGGLDLALYVVRLLFFFEILALVFAWVIATRDEMHLWKRHLVNPSESVERKRVWLAIFGLAVVLGVALAFVYNATFITLFLTVSWLVNYWTQWICLDYFSEALEQTKRQPLSHTRERILSKMKHYWLELPHLGRIATMMFFSSMAFSLALASMFRPAPQRSLLRLLAYSVLFTDILVGESIIWWWRHKRDQEISTASKSGRAHHAYQ